MTSLKNLDAPSIRAVLDVLKKLAPAPQPSTEEISTETGRLRYAEAYGRHRVVLEGEAELNRILEGS